MTILETDRLSLRQLTTADAEFILQLLNEPSWIRFIGEKGVRTLEDARDYILNGPVPMYERHGFGLYLTELKSDGTPIGLCGLIKRDSLEDVDLGFAFLPDYWGQGYAYESSAAILKYGKEVVGLNRIVAITSLENEASVKLLEKLGLTFDRMLCLPEIDEQVRLFV